jgi:hypothetical protein
MRNEFLAIDGARLHQTTARRIAVPAGFQIPEASCFGEAAALLHERSFSAIARDLSPAGR